MYMSVCQASDVFQITRSDLLSSVNNQQGMQSIKSEEEDAFSSVLAEKLKGTYQESKVPYSHLAKDGVIQYNGVVFVCDEVNQAICLGDMNDRKNVISIELENGGRLMVNRNNFSELQSAITMFTPEDINRILRAIADDQKAQKELKEIDEMVNSIGDDIDAEKIAR